jgi:hypothetical protein
MAILKEEVVELECLGVMIGEGYDNMEQFRKEAIQVAAVALSIIGIEEQHKPTGGGEER